MLVAARTAHTDLVADPIVYCTELSEPSVILYQRQRPALKCATGPLVHPVDSGRPEPEVVS